MGKLDINGNSKVVTSTGLSRTLWVVACCLLIFSVRADAVGLGKLRVQSALDQPLSAEIELLSATAAELNTLTIGLGSRSDFRRANVERSKTLSLVKFETAVRQNGDPYVKLSSLDPIAEPFLHFLISLEWAGGKLIREYTALLDPPLYAQGRPASVSSPRIAGRTSPGTGVSQQQVIAAEPGYTRPKPRLGEVYGPIVRGETLSEIAGRMGLTSDVDVFQAMFALLQKNPKAFIRGNINLLKEGSTLSLPGHEEISSISKVVASAEYTKHLNQWMAYRNQVAGAQLDSGVVSAPLRQDQSGLEKSPMVDSPSGKVSDLSEDVLRIIQSGTSTDAAGSVGDAAEIGTLRSQLGVMEESLLSTELENKELRERLAVLEKQIQETNKLLQMNNAGLAIAERKASQPEQTGNAEVVASESETPQRSTRARTQSTTSSIMNTVTDLVRGEMLWKLLLGLAAIVLLIGVIVYLRRRQSYAEFEETMMTGTTYDLRSQSSTYTQMPRMDSQHSQQSTHADSQQTGSLMQTSFMTEMGAPGMGAMQADEVDPIAEAEVYMAYGRDVQAMEVLQDAVRRDPGRTELKIKLLEVYQKRKDVRAFESLAEELYGIIGKDPGKWGRVTEMGRRISPKHPLFAGMGGATVSGSMGMSLSGGDADSQDSSSLDLISVPFSHDAGGEPAGDLGAELDTPSTGVIDFSAGANPNQQVGGGMDVDTDSVSIPMSGSLNLPPTPASTAAGDSMDDFKASEVATKLDLAKAYMEMGDRDAAKGFLDEVLKDGNESQRQQASDLASNF